nr:alpha/beta hydrolase [Streptococcus ovuberis]
MNAVRGWFEEQVNLEEEMVLIGHSIGGDLAAYLACHYVQVKGLLLLDGGFYNMDNIQTLEQELAEAEQFLKETQFDSLEVAIAQEQCQASFWSENLDRVVAESLVERNGKFKLNLELAIVLNLLRLRRQFQGAIHLLDGLPVHLYLPDLGEETPEFKKEALDQLPIDVEVTYLSGCGHSMYTDAPHHVAQVVGLFIRSLE